MGRFGILHFIPGALVAISLFGCGAARAETVLGASFGYTHVSHPDSPNFKDEVVGLPGAQAWGQPGLRVGYFAMSGRWGLNVDFGLVTVRHSGTLGANEATFEALPQIEVGMPGWRGVSPFVNGGIGFVHETAITAYGGAFTATRPVFGFGIGLRTQVSEGHGFLRAEFRYDHLSERETGLRPYDEFTFPAADLLSLKLGFDLVVAR